MSLAWLKIKLYMLETAWAKLHSVELWFCNCKSYGKTTATVVKYVAGAAQLITCILGTITLNQSSHVQRVLIIKVEGIIEDMKTDSSRIHNDEMRGNSHSPQQKKFRLDARGKCLPLVWLCTGTGAPRSSGISSLGHFLSSARPGPVQPHITWVWSWTGWSCVVARDLAQTVFFFFHWIHVFYTITLQWSVNSLFLCSFNTHPCQNLANQEAKGKTVDKFIMSKAHYTICCSHFL